MTDPHEPQPPAPPVPPSPGSFGPPRGFAGPLPGPAPGVIVPPAPERAPAGRPPAPRRSIAPFLLLAIMAVGLIAFGVSQVLGGEDDPGDPADVAAELAAAVDARDGASVCRLLTDDAAQAISDATGSPCGESLRILFARLDDIGTGPVEVVSVDRDGDDATLSFRWDLGEGQLSMQVDGGEWRVDGIDGLTPGATTSVGADPAGSATACTTELRTVQTAVEAYRALTGEDPPDAAALVAEQLLREQPTLAQVLPDGQVIPAGPCA